MTGAPEPVRFIGEDGRQYVSINVTGTRALALEAAKIWTASEGKSYEFLVTDGSARFLSVPVACWAEAKRRLEARWLQNRTRALPGRT